MAIKKITKNQKAKVETLGFVNWSIATKNGGELRSSKGFPIFNNPEYPNPEEALLIEAAKKNGGMVELTMKVRVFACGSDVKKKLPKVSDLL